jgi:hypothetical protein
LEAFNSISSYEYYTIRYIHRNIILFIALHTSIISLFLVSVRIYIIHITVRRSFNRIKRIAFGAEFVRYEFIQVLEEQSPTVVSIS